MEFKQAVVTKQGRELMAKLLAGKQTTFTKVKVSSTVYQDGQLENLTALTNIKQETTAQAYGNNTATVSVVGAIENTGLQTGYYINTMGLYAMDPDKGEILYSVSSASVNGYMPPDTGVSKSGFEFKIYTEVGNANKVDLTVDPAAFATHEDIERISTLKTAYSWSSDGTDRFTNVKPGENLIKYSKFTSNTPLWYFTSSSSEATRGKSDGYFWIEDYDATERRWKQWQITFNDTNEQKESFLKFIASQNKNAALSFNALVKDEISVEPRLIEASVRDNTGRDIANFRISSESLSEEFQRFSIQFKIPEDAGNITNFRVILTYHGFGHCEFSKPKLEFEEYTIYTPAPSEDYENAYPDYIGLAPAYSDKPEDYLWLPEPTKNQKKLDELIELKGQVADMQSWIQAHS
ncbi:hypothetical protein [Enterococcus lactis]|uniref:hypothetical protein n=1 Tax=Enterococcus lactis TaxID=357441 RepID=UPI0022E4F334|nr:hypothetical protein [Enterococcus lactis]